MAKAIDTAGERMERIEDLLLDVKNSLAGFTPVVQAVLTLKSLMEENESILDEVRRKVKILEDISDVVAELSGEFDDMRDQGVKA